MEIRPIFSSLLRNKTAPLLIAAQVALTLAIVSNALFIIRDRLATAARPSGVDEANVSDIYFYPHRDIVDIKDQQRRDLEAVRAIPGVVHAAWINSMPLGRSGWNIGGLTTDPKQTNSSINTAYYFGPDSIVDTLGLQLVEGRDFVEEDILELDPRVSRASPQVVIVTQALGRELFPDATSIVGKTFYLGGGDQADAVRIVGVVERMQSTSAPANARAENSIIAPIRYLDGSTRYAIRSEPGQQARVMADVEKALTGLSKDRIFISQRSFQKIRDGRYAGERMMAGLLIAVTAFLLLITTSGIVGMASLWVNQRRKQIGVRRALGARRGDIIRYFLIENVLITSAGVIAGLVLALVLNDALVRELEIARLPVAYLGIGVAVMWSLGLIAVLGPAWRAAAVPPAIATRTA